MAKFLVSILYTLDLFFRRLHHLSLCEWIQYHDCGRDFTQNGHAQGHQSKSGGLLKEALFLNPGFDSKSYLVMVEAAVHQVMRDFNSKAPLSRRQWHQYAAETHRENLEELRLLNSFPRIINGLVMQDIRQTNVCYACFFGAARTGSRVIMSSVSTLSRTSTTPHISHRETRIRSSPSIRIQTRCVRLCRKIFFQFLLDLVVKTFELGIFHGVLLKKKRLSTP